MAKVVATEAAAASSTARCRSTAAMGVTKDLPLERWYREMRIRRIGEGPSEVQRMIIARELLR